MMELVITDGFTVNPGDLSWDGIAQFGHLTVYERTSQKEVFDRCRNANIILTNKVHLDQYLIENAHSLKLICVLATGYNIVDTRTAKKLNVPVCNVPAYGTMSVAQHTMALILELANQAGLHNLSVHHGEWQNAKDWSYSKTELVELSGKKLGIVGLGHIGEQLARIARTFGMEILYYGPRNKQTILGDFTPLEKLFAEADIISLHCPLTPENVEMVNEKLISTMKTSAFLVNTARGQLINEIDLAHALNSGKIAGAALDVLAIEPPIKNNPLLSAKNCIITPHNAWKTREARIRILATTEENIQKFLQNNPQNLVC
jgi:glycerate dehydrogenase